MNRSLNTLDIRLTLRRGAFALGVDLSLPGRGVTGLFGHSGSGKTSLLRALSGLERAQGKIQVNGNCVTAYATASVVEHVFALILTLQRRLAEQQHAVHSLWPHQLGFSVLDYPTTELCGKNLGIIGHGELGRAVAAIGTALGMQTLLAQRNADDHRTGRLPLDELLREADVVSVHCPLTDTTRGLIGARELTLMKSSSTADQYRARWDCR